MGQPGDVAAGPRQAVHETPPDGVDDVDEHDRHAVALALERRHDRPGGGEHHLGAGAQKLPRHRLRARRLAGSEAHPNLDVAALDPAEGMEPLAEGCETRLPFRISFGEAEDDADPSPPLGRLRSARSRPCRHTHLAAQ